MDNILTIDDLTVSFNGNKIIKDISLELAEGQIFGLVGPNGAGKTTLLRGILNTIPKLSGNILYRSKNITNMKTYEIVKNGISITEQLVQTLDRMSVMENVLIGFPEGKGDGFLSAFSHSRSLKRIEEERKKEAKEFLEFVGLEINYNCQAGALSYGQKKRLDIARGLATKPDVFLMDEPTAGLDTEGIEQIIAILKNLKRRKIMIFLVEHNMDVIREICDSIAFMQFGEIKAIGIPNNILDSPDIIDLYMGKNE